MKVGFIGLGTMGGHIALNAVRSGNELVVHDLNEEAAGPHVNAGATWADSPRAVAEAAEVIFTSLPGPVEVEAVAGAMADGMRAGQAFFDLSTNSPTVVREIGARLAERGVAMLDAPVSGGPEGARTGKLAIWVGGDKETYERFLPVLRTMSDQPAYVGPLGAGSIAKLVHNLSGYMVQTALAEAFTMGVKAGEAAGVDAEAIWRAVRQGALGRRRTFDMLAKNYLPGRFDPPDFALALARKDVRLACELGREFDVPMRIANLTLQEMTEAVNRGWEGRDSRSTMLLQEERAGGVEVRVDPARIGEILEE